MQPSVSPPDVSCACVVALHVQALPLQAPPLLLPSTLPPALRGGQLAKQPSSGAVEPETPRLLLRPQGVMHIYARCLCLFGY